MNPEITLKAPVELGFVPTHAKFVGGLVPGEDGKLPRNESGELVMVAATRDVVERCRVKTGSVQIPVFPGTLPEEYDMMISDFKAIGQKVHFVMMLAGVDPMDPADEEATVEQMKPTLEAAKRNGVTHISATSVEQWMQPGAKRKDGADFEAAVEQNIKVHLRAYQEGGLEGSCVEAWDIEFLRPGEFQTFTDVGRLWTFVSKLNERLGKPFFRCLIDAAHCGDSGLGIAENQKLIEEIAAGGGLGVMHASAKTTRGCLSTDDGWVAALFEPAAKSGKLAQVFVEMFHHEDDALGPLRDLDPGHGIDTTDGRDYTQVVADGLENLAHILNNYVTRGYMPKA
ncbi:hypothetical protein HAHE_27040 [Haloferula helveola]|uniref:Xylose isomerase-like TIM barrel domain-containing protein n=1 Tax=Haloferula helveola TaxID=490095 RepID=A0ABN6H575_9BACT|nr:hypothetical protein HAHE_27040 [Haloferula helveola]